MNRLIVIVTLFSLLCSCQEIFVGMGSGPVKTTHPEHKKHHEKAHGHEKKGPPSHAKAHGHKKIFKYHYYPDQEVYYSEERSLYFWTDGKDWHFSAKLPAGNVLGNDVRVELELCTDKPYEEHEKVKNDHPGKKHSHGKGKGKGKDKGHPGKSKHKKH